jgi:Domain of unknown function (DUF4331)
MKNRTMVAIATCAVIGGGALVAAGAGAADHLDAPNVRNDGRTDINDLYAFQSPNDPANTVLVMTVNPAVGVFSGDTFRQGAEYTFNIDQNGDAVADRTATVKFSGPVKQAQKFQLKLANGPTARGVVGETTTIDGGGMITAGTFEDPFFFDLAGFRNGFAFDGTDFFAGLDTSAIFIEVPSTWVNGATSNVGIWATTSIDGRQIDRFGRPAINTVLIPSHRKDEFNQTAPKDDLAAFGADVKAAITALSSEANADALTPILLPDVMTFDTSNAGGFLNGRRLHDDVIDIELGLLSAGAVTTDFVDANDVAFGSTFPYLAPANG